MKPLPRWSPVLPLAAGAFIGAALAIWTLDNPATIFAGQSTSKPTTFELFDETGTLRFKVGPREKGSRVFAVEMYYSDGAKALDLCTAGRTKDEGTASVNLYQREKEAVASLSVHRGAAWLSLGQDYSEDAVPALHLGVDNKGYPSIELKPRRNQKSMTLWVLESGPEIGFQGADRDLIWHAP